MPVQLIGSKQRPIYHIKQDMKFSPDCKIEYCQLSENGLWLEFYSLGDGRIEKEFEFPLIHGINLQEIFLQEV